MPLISHVLAFAKFATSTLQNELLVIIEQQKVHFMLIFAANPITYLKCYQMLNFYKND